MILKYGDVVVHFDGWVEVKGFHFGNMETDDAFKEALAWAIKHLQARHSEVEAGKVSGIGSSLLVGLSPPDENAYSPRGQ